MKQLQLIALLCLAGSLSAQRLTASWSSDSMEIGQQVQLTIRIKPIIEKLNYKALEGEISCEMLSDRPAAASSRSSTLTTDGTMEVMAFRDTVFGTGNNRIWEGVYTVTVWDTGYYLFPVIYLPLKDSTYRIQPEVLTVNFVKRKYDDDIEEVEVDLPSRPWWWLSYWWVLLFPLAAGVIFWLRKRNSVKIVRQLSLKQRTIIGLQALRKQGYWKAGKFNEHYVEFSFLLRSFLSSRYDLNLMERTSYEAVLLLRARNVPPDTLQRIQYLFQESDRVKFAGDVPDEATILKSLAKMEELVIELSPLDIVNE